MIHSIIQAVYCVLWAVSTFALYRVSGEWMPLVFAILWAALFVGVVYDTVTRKTK